MAEKNSKINLFTFLKDITYHKNGDLLTDSTRSVFNKFMILRFISMDDDLIAISNILNKYQATLSKSQLYKLLLYLIPKQKRFLNYIGKNKSEKENDKLINLLKDYYRISDTEAQQYADIMSDSEKKRFIYKFGGKIDQTETA